MKIIHIDIDEYFPFYSITKSKKDFGSWHLAREIDDSLYLRLINCFNEFKNCQKILQELVENKITINEAERLKEMVKND